mmetsp:Transcript_7544/g.25653  ORF Transcript_7544/g.25653 Transcript_7544/m.25653 type:complete len:119 (+) Transcript_7544:31-387(+)
MVALAATHALLLLTSHGFAGHTLPRTRSPPSALYPRLRSAMSADDPPEPRPNFFPMYSEAELRALWEVHSTFFPEDADERVEEAGPPEEESGSSGAPFGLHEAVMDALKEADAEQEGN